MDMPDGMVFVPGSEFIMGTPSECTLMDSYVDNVDTLEDAHPAKLVYLDDYFIDAYPVTNRQYHQFTEATGYPVPFEVSFNCEYSWDRSAGLYPAGMGDYPVVLVSWYDALAYCEWAGRRLPTEAEWEKAARGVSELPVSGGCELPLSERTHAPNVTNVMTGEEPLRSVYANPESVSPFGCFDMLGNAEEWCSDWYGFDYYQHMPYRNPKGVEHATACKVVRGWMYASMRSCQTPWNHYLDVGFRCAMSTSVLECGKHAEHVIGYGVGRWCTECGRPVGFNNSIRGQKMSKPPGRFLAATLSEGVSRLERAQDHGEWREELPGNTELGIVHFNN